MFFIVLGIIITMLIMCLPVTAAAVSKKSGVKLLKPLCLGVLGMLCSSLLSAAVMLAYEIIGGDFLSSFPMQFVKWLLTAAFEVAALMLIMRFAYKNKISGMETITLASGLCAPMLYSRGISVVMAFLSYAAEGETTAAGGWILFYMLTPAALVVLFEYAFALVLAVGINKNKPWLNALWYALEIAFAYNMSEVTQLMKASAFAGALLNAALICSGVCAVMYVRKEWNNLPTVNQAAINGKRTRLKEDKYAWPGAEAFPQAERPKQIHSNDKKK